MAVVPCVPLCYQRPLADSPRFVVQAPDLSLLGVGSSLLSHLPQTFSEAQQKITQFQAEPASVTYCPKSGDLRQHLSGICFNSEMWGLFGFAVSVALECPRLVSVCVSLSRRLLHKTNRLSPIWISRNPGFRKSPGYLSRILWSETETPNGVGAIVQ